MSNSREAEVLRYMRRHPECPTYERAERESADPLTRQLDEVEDLFGAWKPGMDEVRRALRYQRDAPGTDYETALKYIMLENSPGLRAAVAARGEARR